MRKVAKRNQKLGPRPEFQDDAEEVLRRWPHLPDYVRKTVLELISHYGPAAVSARFPTPRGAEWSEVNIVLLSPDTARITVRDVSEQYTFAGVGLANVRAPKKPRAEWRMLRTYAENPEPDAYFRLPYRENLKMEISKFRRWLQAFFGIPGDPLRPFKSAHWLPRFNIAVEYGEHEYQDTDWLGEGDAE